MDFSLKFFAIIFISSYAILSPNNAKAQEIDSDFDNWSDSSNWGRIIPTILSGIQSSISSLINLPSTLISSSSSSGGIPDIGLIFNNIFTSFVNQTRQTIPEIVHHSNFTLIQAGLLFAIGAMATGAAIIVAEGFHFRQQETDLENYHKRVSAAQHHHAASKFSNDYLDNDGINYKDNFGYNYGNDGSPGYSYAYNQNEGNGVRRLKSRTKRDSSSYPLVITKPYGHGTNNRQASITGSKLNLQQSGGGIYGGQNQNYQNYHENFDPIAQYSNIQSQSLNLGGHSADFIPNNYQQQRPQQFAHETNPYLYENRLGMKRKKNGPIRGIFSPNLHQFGDSGALNDQDMEYSRGLPVFERRSGGFSKISGINGNKRHKHRKRYDDLDADKFQKYQDLDAGNNDKYSFDSYGQSDALENRFYVDADIYYDALRKYEKRLNRKRRKQLRKESFLTS